jgi:hypothetical protein
MARNFRLWQNAQVVMMLAPAADAAGRTSPYLSMKFAHKGFLLCTVNQGSGSTVLWTPLQAQDMLGTNSKVLTAPAPIAVNLDCLTIPSDQMAIIAAAANYTTDTGLKAKIVLFEIDPIESMDTNSQTLNAAGIPHPFDHIAVSTGASNIANITAAFFIGQPLRDARQNPPTTNI